MLKDLRANLPTTFSNADDVARNAMRLEARKLMLDLEEPGEVLHRVGFQLWESVAINTAVKMHLFPVLVNAPGGLSTAQLAKACNAEPLFTERLLRCLASYGAVRQTGPDAYAPNTVTRACATPKGENWANFTFDIMAPGWILMADQLEKTGFRCLTSDTDTVFNRAYPGHEGQTFWQMAGSKGWGPAMGSFMATFNEGSKDWLDFYPFEQRIIKGATTDADADAVFMVDVGGYTGTQAAGVKQRFPHAPGRFVIQDLPHALPSTPPGESIELMAHDFFTPQPLKGARLYYLRYITHDWSNARCTAIIENLKSAMAPGYSKVIIHDWIVPEKDPSMFMTSQDLNMMSFGGGEERSEARHREYIEAAGLVVSGVWDLQDGISEGIIECELRV